MPKLCPPPSPQTHSLQIPPPPPHLRPLHPNSAGLPWLVSRTVKGNRIKWGLKGWKLVELSLLTNGISKATTLRRGRGREGTGLLAAHTIYRCKQGGVGGQSSLFPPSTREGQRLKEMGIGKGRNVLAGGGPPSIPWGLGGGESLKCFQKMRKWSLPLEWLVTPP